MDPITITAGLSCLCLSTSTLVVAIVVGTVARRRARAATSRALGAAVGLESGPVDSGRAWQTGTRSGRAVALCRTTTWVRSYDDDMGSTAGKNVETVRVIVSADLPADCSLDTIRHRAQSDDADEVFSGATDGWTRDQQQAMLSFVHQFGHLFVTGNPPARRRPPGLEGGVLGLETFESEPSAASVEAQLDALIRLAELLET